MTRKNIYSPPNANLISSAETDPNNSAHTLASRWARPGASLIDAVVMGLPFAALNAAEQHVRYAFTLPLKRTS
jgi:hypothetical protein